MINKIIRPTVWSTMRHGLLCLGAIALTTISATSLASASELAMATLTATQAAPGENHYSLTLNDTGTTTIGTFWFGWVPGDNFMPVSPTSISSPAGWMDAVTQGGPSDGFAIQWQASAASSDLNAGGSLSGFSFDSSLTLAQLEAGSTGHPADPVLTAFVYSGAPFSDAGVQITSTATPEPTEMALASIGFLFLIIAARRKERRES